MANSKFDWEWIEQQWRAGDLTPRTIAKEYTRIYGQALTHETIRKRARRKGWNRDLTKKVNNRAAAKALTADVPPGTKDETIIEEAATRVARILSEHLFFASRLRAGAAKVLDDVEAGYSSLMKVDANGIESEIRIPLDPKEKATMLSSAATAGDKAVGIERKNLMLDVVDSESGGKTVLMIMDMDLDDDPVNSGGTE